MSMSNAKSEYNSGPMPGTDLRYEDFEVFLASFALTFACLEKSTQFSDPQDHTAIIEILDGFADRYRVQRPRQAIAMPRRKRAIVRAHEYTNEETLQMVASFSQDFRIGHAYGGANYDLDGAEIVRLRRIILDLLNVYAVAEIISVNVKGERVPARVKHWVHEENRIKYFSESVRRWAEWRAE
jgi:hypothetical protein